MSLTRKEECSLLSIKLVKGSWECSTEGGGRQRVAYVTALKQDHPIQTGFKVICAPCVGRWFHQAFVGWRGHDLCSWWLGTASAQRQEARLYGNQDTGIFAAGIYWEFFHKVDA